MQISRRGRGDAGVEVAAGARYLHCKLEENMREAAKKFEFEKAAKLRDTIKELRTKGVSLQLGTPTPSVFCEVTCSNGLSKTRCKAYMLF